MTLKDEDRSKYLREAVPRVHRETIEDRANAAVDIREIYNQTPQLHAPLGEYFSWKIDCPFWYEHADGGRDKNCRMYPPHHIYCWAQHGLITPVRLYSRLKGLSYKDSAIELLKERGLLKSDNYRERWAELTQKDDLPNNPAMSQAFAVDALRQALNGIPSFSDKEFSSEVRAQMQVCLEDLDYLWTNSNPDVTILSDWLTRSVLRIRTVL